MHKLHDDAVAAMTSEPLSLEHIADALEAAKALVNHSSVWLRDQGFPVGQYERGSISGQLLDAHTSMIGAGRLIGKLKESDGKPTVRARKRGRRAR